MPIQLHLIVGASFPWAGVFFARPRAFTDISRRALWGCSSGAGHGEGAGWSACGENSPPSPGYTITDAGFTLQSPTHPPTAWQTNGTAGLALNPTAPVPVSLALTHNLGNEGGTGWTLVKARVPSFTTYTDVSINWNGDFKTGCPADGFAMAFANTDPNVVAGTGGSLGLFGNPTAIPQFIGFEINLWRDQALVDRTIGTTGKFLTFGFEDASSKATNDRSAGKNGTTDAGGAKLAQTTIPAGLNVLNGGWYRYQWDVDGTAGLMDAYITGLESGTKAVQNMKLTEVTMGPKAPGLSFSGRWGVTGGTGGAVAGINVARIRVVAPAVAPGP